MFDEEGLNPPPKSFISLKRRAEPPPPQNTPAVIHYSLSVNSLQFISETGSSSFKLAINKD